MKIKDSDILLVNRGGVDYSIKALDLREQAQGAGISDTDIMLVNRENTDYNASGKDVQDYLYPKMPWDDWAGCVFHLKNATGEVSFNFEVDAYTIDGTSLGYIKKINPGDEVVILTNTAPKYIFQQNKTASWDFGELTDTSNMTDASYIFYYATEFNGLGLHYWDVSKVTTMYSMFAYCDKFNSPDIADWDISNVESMQSMFTSMSSHVTAFNVDISKWDVSKVTRMGSMFSYQTVFNQDIGGWNVSKVTNMNSMFNGVLAFNQDLTEWCVPTITSKPWGYAPSLEDKNLPVWGTCPRGENQ